MSDFLRIETLTDMLKALELPKPKHPLVAYIDFSETPFSQEIPSHKVVCDFYQISLKGETHGSIKYGRETYDYQEGSLVFVAPDQVVDYSTTGSVETTSGWSLFFHADLLRSFPLGEKMNEYEFFSYRVNEALHISEKEKETIESIIENIKKELASNIDDFSEEVIVSNLELLLNYSKRYYNRQFITRKRFSNDVITEFTEVLNSYFEDGKQRELGIPTAHFLADKLNYSSNYLNELVKKSTDKTIVEHVHHKVIELAKTSLLNSNRSVSEIAFDLGFEYSQYFSRLFKKKTGMTPIEYRKAS